MNPDTQPLPADSSVRVRMAPSPTGLLHVGTARTTLFNFLFARKHGGAFVMRIEDTDRARSRPEYTEHILEGLRWLGITWDEGPDVGGPYEPYTQSQRHALYMDAVRSLLASGKAYELEGAVLLRVQETEPILIHDLIRGDVRFAPDQVKDFVIAKPREDGRGEEPWDPLFHLSVVVDDAAMHITHVIRGEDHLSNTPKHMLLQRALGLPTPQYAHLPLLLDEQRHKLSKRSAVTGIEAYREKGYLPQTLINFLALLGWNPKTDQEVFTLPELIERFSPSGIQKGGAVFDTRKLNWLQREHVRRLPSDELFSLAQPFLAPLLTTLDHPPAAEVLTRALHIWQQRGERFETLANDIELYVKEPTVNADDLVWKEATKEKTLEALQRSKTLLEELPNEAWESGEHLQNTLRGIIDTREWDRATILWPLRMALSGQRQSPSPGEIAWVIGLAAAHARIERAEQILRAIIEE